MPDLFKQATARNKQAQEALDSVHTVKRRAALQPPGADTNADKAATAKRGTWPTNQIPWWDRAGKRVSD